MLLALGTAVVLLAGPAAAGVESATTTGTLGDQPSVAWHAVRDRDQRSLHPGLTDRMVAQLQRHLTGLGVYRGEIDGVFGRETAAAVVAVHKLAGAERDAVWQPEDWTIELDHRAILDRHPDETDRLEVDIARQVLFVIKGGEVAAILPVSSGNGALYWSKNGGTDGGYVRAQTPRGDFKLFKHINGWRTNYLGSLYKPWYFTPYYAVHGSSSVPAHPASHGCVRVPTWESDHLDSMLYLGLPVHIWDEPYAPAPAAEPATADPPGRGTPPPPSELR